MLGRSRSAPGQVLGMCLAALAQTLGQMLGQMLGRACSPWRESGGVLGEIVSGGGESAQRLGRFWADAGQITCIFWADSRQMPRRS